MKMFLLYHGDCDTPKWEIHRHFNRFVSSFNSSLERESGPDFVVELVCSRYEKNWGKLPDEIRYVEKEMSIEDGREYVLENSFVASLQIEHEKYLKLKQSDYIFHVLTRIYELISQAEPKSEQLESFFDLYYDNLMSFKDTLA